MACRPRQRTPRKGPCFSSPVFSSSSPLHTDSFLLMYKVPNKSNSGKEKFSSPHSLSMWHTTVGRHGSEVGSSCVSRSGRRLVTLCLPSGSKWADAGAELASSVLHPEPQPLGWCCPVRLASILLRLLWEHPRRYTHR